jgi:hypothetical protein
MKIPPQLYDITSRLIIKDAPDNIAVGTITAEVESAVRRYVVLMEGRWKGTVRASAESEFAVGDRVNLILPGGDPNNAQIVGYSSKTNPVTVTVIYGEGDRVASSIEDPLITMIDEAYIRAREALSDGKIPIRYTVPFLYRAGMENLRPGEILRVTAPEVGLVGEHLYVESISESYNNKTGHTVNVTGIVYQEWETGETRETGVTYWVTADGSYVVTADGSYVIV